MPRSSHAVKRTFQDHVDRVASGFRIATAVAIHLGLFGGLGALGWCLLRDPGLWFVRWTPVAFGVAGILGTPITLVQLAARINAPVRSLVERLATTTGLTAELARGYRLRPAQVVGVRDGVRVVVRLPPPRRMKGRVVGERVMVSVDDPVHIGLSRVGAPAHAYGHGLKPVECPLPDRMAVSRSPVTLARMLADPAVLARVETLTAGDGPRPPGGPRADP